MEPPQEAKIDGEIWKLKKAGYGLYDGARKWFIGVTEDLKKLGLRHIIGDEAVFYYRSGDKTEGCLLLHCDDFLAVGSEMFFENVVEDLKKKYQFSKIEKNSFRFTGIDINFTEDGIFMGQTD